MATERDLELLDDYVGNRLKGAEKEQFERLLEKDPNLATELKFQQSIANALRKARAAELKNRLKSIPSSSIQGNGPMKMWLGGIGAVITTVALYLYFSPSGFISDTSNQASQETATQAPIENAPVVQSQPIKEYAAENSPANTTKPEGSSDKQSRQGKQEVVTNPTALDVFDPMQESAEESESPSITSTAETIRKVSPEKSKIEASVEKGNKKYSFHYQFKDGKLTLYGAFDNNLYEILEFITDKHHTVFLFYKNNYYLLNQDTDKVKPLVAVNDPVLIQKLKESR